MKQEKRKNCCLCGREFIGHGYNPYPVKESGECCRQCNYEVVVPERYIRHYKYQKTKDDE